MYNFFKVTFALTTTIYVLTLIFASYVGVYLTYVAVPIILVSGIFTYFLSPKEQAPTQAEQTISDIDARIAELDKRLNGEGR